MMLTRPAIARGRMEAYRRDSIVCNSGGKYEGRPSRTNYQATRETLQLRTMPPDTGNSFAARVGLRKDTYHVRYTFFYASVHLFV